jgi:hypothetical protein
MRHNLCRIVYAAHRSEREPSLSNKEDRLCPLYLYHPLKMRSRSFDSTAIIVSDLYPSFKLVILIFHEFTFFLNEIFCKEARKSKSRPPKPLIEATNSTTASQQVNVSKWQQYWSQHNVNRSPLPGHAKFSSCTVTMWKESWGAMAAHKCLITSCSQPLLF